MQSLTWALRNALVLAAASGQYQLQLFTPDEYFGPCPF